MKNVDELDEKILRALTKGASMSYENIAREVGASVGTIHNRIKRMKEERVITRIIPEIDATKLGLDICVLIDVRIKGGHLEEVQKKFSQYKNICSIYDITGEYDTTFIAKFENTNQLNKVIKELASHKHVIRTSTKLVLNVIKEGFIPRI